MLLLLRLILLYGLLMLAALASAVAVLDPTASPSSTFDSPSSDYEAAEAPAAADDGDGDGSPVDYWRARVHHVTSARTKKTSADQRLAELQALFAMSDDGMGGYGHGHFDPFAAGRRRRSIQTAVRTPSVESPEVSAVRPHHPPRSGPSAAATFGSLPIGPGGHMRQNHIRSRGK